MKVRDFIRHENRKYESWVFKRIKDKKALCHCYRGHKCIPSNDETCRSCYQKECAKS
jgi:hypothetical protein